MASLPPLQATNLGLQLHSHGLWGMATCQSRGPDLDAPDGAPPPAPAASPGDAVQQLLAALHPPAEAAEGGGPPAQAPKWRQGRTADV